MPDLQPTAPASTIVITSAYVTALAAFLWRALQLVFLRADRNNGKIGAVSKPVNAVSGRFLGDTIYGDRRVTVSAEPRARQRSCSLDRGRPDDGAAMRLSRAGLQSDAAGNA